jgi:hypothetical protein
MVAQLRGAALMAAVTLGRHQLGDVASLGPRGRAFSPNAAVADLYDSRRTQFPTMYERDKKWMRRTTKSSPIH